MLDATTKQELLNAATRMRIMSIECSETMQTGFPTSCASAAEIMSCLFYKAMHVDVNHPRNPNSDRFVLSKGHAASILYAAWTDVGFLKPEHLRDFCNKGCELSPCAEFVDVATASLGLGLSAAAGMAYVGKYVDSKDASGHETPYRVFCLLGDGETAEGCVWEAIAFASHYKLDNLCAIIDVNRLGQGEPTMLQHHTEIYKARLEAFGWRCHVVDGHDVEKLVETFETVTKHSDGRPTCIVARTTKGHDMLDLENKDGWHGKVLKREVSGKVLEHLKKKLKDAGASDTPASGKLKPQPPRSDALKDRREWLAGKTPLALSKPPSYKQGESVPTSRAYGSALLKLAEINHRVICLDGDVQDSTHTQILKNSLPDQFLECFIAEQNMVGVAIGAAARCRTLPFVSSFASVLMGASSKIRASAFSQSHCNFCGLSMGEEEAGQLMALEDLALFRSVPHAIVFYPSDAVATERAVELAANQPSICYIRTDAHKVPIIYSSQEEFRIGKAKILRQSDQDKVTIVGSGATLAEALKAADHLAGQNIQVRVIDPFTVKPLDKCTIVESVRATQGRVITVELHHPEGGIGEAVLSALSEEANVRVKVLAVHGVPHNGKLEEFLATHGLDEHSIVKTVKEFIQN